MVLYWLLSSGTHLPSNALIGPPAQPFDDDAFDEPQAANNHNDRRPQMSSSHTGYSQLHTDSDSSDDY